MSETKFTKGRWVAHTPVDGRSFAMVQIIGMGGFDISGMPDCVANCHLIAAAPEMYSLLDEISDGLLEAGGTGNCELAKRIEALLAKARGEA
jgi:hypothetical protein